MNKHSSENILDNNGAIKLQVLICTLGEAGIQRVAKGEHPRVPGVEYLVSWQLPDGDVAIPDELLRPDFRIIKNATRGLSRNRNLSIAAATAPYCLISDDDLDYFADSIAKIIDIFDKNPELDIATFKYSGADTKQYPDYSFNLSKPPKGYYISSVEIAFNRNKISETGVLFNERFGVGAEFPAGEEDIWIHDLLKRKLNGEFFPITIAYHPRETTGTRRASDPDIIRTKGAVFSHTHPLSWPLRMLAHVWRNYRSKTKISTYKYLKSWLKGAL